MVKVSGDGGWIEGAEVFRGIGAVEFGDVQIELSGGEGESVFGRGT